MRRYWHPITTVSQMKDHYTAPIRLLGEDLVLYKDRSGQYGLIQPQCAHRRMGLIYAIPEQHGIRCAYHGWVYDETGQCIEQPFEESEDPDGRFREKVRIKAYRVEAVGGLIFAYMGPEPAPLVPRWGLVGHRRRSPGGRVHPSCPTIGSSARRTPSTRSTSSGCTATSPTTSKR